MTESRVGTQFGPYHLDELIGRGGMGEVFRAYDTVKDRVVALKVLNAGLADSPEYRERFRRESRTAARLGEPHVIPIHDWGEIGGALFIDMRMVAGTDLRGVLRAEQRLEPRRAVTIIDQIASALNAAHRDHLVHRDVKPENILIADKDFAYLVDFGIANAAGDTRLTQTGSAIGSVSYMAPELFDGAVAGPPTDIYALTCVLFESLTGQVPYPAVGMTATIKAILTDPTPRASGLVPSIPAALDAVIEQGLATDPARRFPSAGDLADAALAALDGTGHMPAPPTVHAPGRTAGGPMSPTLRNPSGPPPNLRKQSEPVQQPSIPDATVHRQTRSLSDPGTPISPKHPGPDYPYPVHAPHQNSPLVPVLAGVAALLAVGIIALIVVALSANNGRHVGPVAGTSAAVAVPVTETLTTTVNEAAPSTNTPGTPTVRTYPAPTPIITASADPSDPGYVPPPPSIDDARYFAQFGAFKNLANAQERAGMHYGSVIADGSFVGLSTNYVVLRATHSLAEAQQVCSHFDADRCLVQRRSG